MDKQPSMKPEHYKGLGHKSHVKQIRTGWCGFCQKSAPLKRVRGIGYLCPICGGHLLGKHPGITRQIYHGGMGG